MDKLTEVELAVLPEHGAKAGKWANAVLAWRANGHPDCVDCFNMRHSLAENQANRVAYLCHELARALGDTARYREALVYYDSLGLGKDAEGRTLADYVLKGDERDDNVDG